MIVTVKTEQAVDLQEYYVMRGIRGGIGETKNVITEREFTTRPTMQDVAKLIMETGCDFVSVVTNYRIVKDDEFPFS